MRSCLRTIVLCLTALTWAAPASAADLQIRAAEVVAYGVFEANTVERRAKLGNSRSLAGDQVEKIHFVDFTNDIPGELGTSFGIQYVINSYPRGQRIDVDYVIRFPGEGLQLPDGRIYVESKDRSEARFGERILHGYAFDEAWEIVPGEWVFEVWYNDARIIRKRFNVLPPETAAAE